MRSKTSLGRTKSMTLGCSSSNGNDLPKRAAIQTLTEVPAAGVEVSARYCLRHSRGLAAFGAAVEARHKLLHLRKTSATALARPGAPAGAMSGAVALVTGLWRRWAPACQLYGAAARLLCRGLLWRSGRSLGYTCAPATIRRSLQSATPRASQVQPFQRLRWQLASCERARTLALCLRCGTAAALKLGAATASSCE